MSRFLQLLKPAAITAAAVTGAGLAGAVVGTAVLGTLAARKLRTSPVPDGSVVVVTGGSRGLGLAIAQRFAKRPVRLVLCSRKREELEQAQAQILAKSPHLKPEDFYLVAADLSEATECQRLIAETIVRFGRIDILVNCAGIIQVGPIEAQTTQAFEKAMRLNFFAALYTIWAALPHMRTQLPLARKQRASIVNIASIGGKFSVPHMLPYSAAKFALVGFSEGLHAELRAKSIRVTTVCPGLMRTGGEAHAEFVGDKDAERRWFDFAAKTPGVATTAEHAANAIYAAVAAGRAEITITPQAWMGARFAGLCPETLQWMNAQANEYVLPKAPQQP
jgi:NAD(P)-dependent dehydrogenase (short-subunit alcohol dehydrogenase family)